MPKEQTNSNQNIDQALWQEALANALAISDNYHWGQHGQYDNFSQRNLAAQGEFQQSFKEYFIQKECPKNEQKYLDDQAVYIAGDENIEQSEDALNNSEIIKHAMDTISSSQEYESADNSAATFTQRLTEAYNNFRTEIDKNKSLDSNQKNGWLAWYKRHQQTILARYLGYLLKQSKDPNQQQSEQYAALLNEELAKVNDKENNKHLKLDQLIKEAKQDNDSSSNLFREKIQAFSKANAAYQQVESAISNNGESLKSQLNKIFYDSFLGIKMQSTHLKALKQSPETMQRLVEMVNKRLEDNDDLKNYVIDTIYHDKNRSAALMKEQHSRVAKFINKDNRLQRRYLQNSRFVKTLNKYRDGQAYSDQTKYVDAVQQAQDVLDDAKHKSAEDVAKAIDKLIKTYTQGSENACKRADTINQDTLEDYLNKLLNKDRSSLWNRMFKTSAYTKLQQDKDQILKVWNKLFESGRNLAVVKSFADKHWGQVVDILRKKVAKEQHKMTKSQRELNKGIIKASELEQGSITDESRDEAFNAIMSAISSSNKLKQKQRNFFQNALLNATKSLLDGNKITLDEKQRIKTQISRLDCDNRLFSRLYNDYLEGGKSDQNIEEQGRPRNASTGEDYYGNIQSKGQFDPDLSKPKSTKLADGSLEDREKPFARDLALANIGEGSRRNRSNSTSEVDGLQPVHKTQDLYLAYQVQQALDQQKGQQPVQEQRTEESVSSTEDKDQGQQRPTQQVDWGGSLRGSVSGSDDMSEAARELQEELARTNYSSSDKLTNAQQARDAINNATTSEQLGAVMQQIDDSFYDPLQLDNENNTEFRVDIMSAVRDKNRNLGTINQGVAQYRRAWQDMLSLKDKQQYDQQEQQDEEQTNQQQDEEQKRQQQEAELFKRQADKLKNLTEYWTVDRPSQRISKNYNRKTLTRIKEIVDDMSETLKNQDSNQQTELLKQESVIEAIRAAQTFCNTFFVADQSKKSREKSPRHNPGAQQVLSIMQSQLTEINERLNELSPKQQHHSHDQSLEQDGSIAQSGIDDTEKTSSQRKQIKQDPYVSKKLNLEAESKTNDVSKTQELKQWIDGFRDTIRDYPLTPKSRAQLVEEFGKKTEELQQNLNAKDQTDRLTTRLHLVDRYRYAYKSFIAASRRDLPEKPPKPFVAQQLNATKPVLEDLEEQLVDEQKSVNECKSAIDNELDKIDDQLENRSNDTRKINIGSLKQATDRLKEHLKNTGKGQVKTEQEETMANDIRGCYVELSKLDGLSQKQKDTLKDVKEQLDTLHPQPSHEAAASSANNPQCFWQENQQENQVGSGIAPTLGSKGDE